ncbi:hypothetical protein ASPTUDRAFT_617649 [Aspergillus tubingensis CBS 134.48]|uniref:Uncharacterized protein n=1 Tax=Aspergillus tubingensis (strain CBS 134.48) TaxID=767770 RepID=A0A1L9N3A6_ASPTC|nr:hypothetical protein ASPTUDRAFT_617649 [Aspergillus tubingensis CBS 134.48]
MDSILHPSSLPPLKFSSICHNADIFPFSSPLHTLTRYDHGVDEDVLLQEKGNKTNLKRTVQLQNPRFEIQLAVCS